MYETLTCLTTGQIRKLKQALSRHWWKRRHCEHGTGGEAAAVPDVVNDEAGGGDEEVVHPVEAPADRLRVHRVVRDSSAGLINHLQHSGWRGRWAVNMSQMDTFPPSGLIKIQHSAHLNPHRWRDVILETFHRVSLFICPNFYSLPANEIMS